MADQNIIGDWSSYLEYGERQFFRKKEVIYREKEASAKGFYYLKEGFVKISTTFHQGEERIIDIVSDKKLFGEQGVDGGGYFSTASTLEDSVIYFFLYENIVDRLIEDETLSSLFYDNLTEKLHILSDHLLLDSLPSEKLLARTILVLRDKFVSEVLPFSQQELCRYTNLNRITVYNVFQKWKDNVVSMDNKMIHIKDINRLKEIAAL